METNLRQDVVARRLSVKQIKRLRQQTSVWQQNEIGGGDKSAVCEKTEAADFCMSTKRDARTADMQASVMATKRNRRTADSHM